MKKSIEFLKYVAVGGITFAFEYGSFLILVYPLSLNIAVGHVVSYLFALLINFILLRYWAFLKGRKGNVLPQASKFLLLVMFNLPVTTVLIGILNGSGVQPFLAKLVVVVTAALWNYVIYNKLIFNEKKADA